MRGIITRSMRGSKSLLRLEIPAKGAIINKQQPSKAKAEAALTNRLGIVDA